jgi:hypothetical protein
MNEHPPTQTIGEIAPNHVMARKVLDFVAPRWPHAEIPLRVLAKEHAIRFTGTAINAQADFIALINDDAHALPSVGEVMAAASAHAPAKSRRLAFGNRSARSCTLGDSTDLTRKSAISRTSGP